MTSKEMVPIALDKLMEEINSLKTAKALLDECWVHLGPYTSQLPPHLVDKLRTFYRFNDDE